MSVACKIGSSIHSYRMFPIIYLSTYTLILKCSVVILVVVVVDLEFHTVKCLWKTNIFDSRSGSGRPKPITFPLATSPKLHPQYSRAHTHTESHTLKHMTAPPPCIYSCTLMLCKRFCIPPPSLPPPKGLSSPQLHASDRGREGAELSCVQTDEGPKRA